MVKICKDEYKNDHPQPIGNTLHENVKINKTTVEYGDGENRYKFNYGGDGLDFNSISLVLGL